ncbi:MAG TPA: ASCH domain-containing protein [Flavisolibacter sp.]|nr:ASCH domain-containing protein [Flavisolibacter sp.]
MKVLSFLQPWASLTVMGLKKLETRSWSTRHRGDLLIHASMGRSGALLASEPPFSKYIPDFSRLPFGAIIGKAVLIDVIKVELLHLSEATINRLSLEERAFGDYSNGRYVWVLEEPEIFRKPVMTKGTLGLWNFDL